MTARQHATSAGTMFGTMVTVVTLMVPRESSLLQHLIFGVICVISGTLMGQSIYAAAAHLIGREP